MNKEFIPYKQALELKELGFDEPCFGFYTEEYKSLIKNFCKYPINLPTKPFLAPTFSQAFRFFREKYDITQTIARDGSLAKKDPWAYTIVCDNIIFNDGYLTYEEAELACLNKLIEIANEKSI